MIVKTILSCAQHDLPADGPDPVYFDLGLKTVRIYYDSSSREKAYEKGHVITKYYGGSVGVVLVNLYVLWLCVSLIKLLYSISLKGL